MRLVRITSFALCVAASVAGSQTQQGTAKASKPPKDKVADNTTTGRFFEVGVPLPVTLTTNFGRLRGDKNAETAPWRPATVTVAGADTAHLAIPARVKTRGIWRLKNCQYPPIRLNFTSEAVKHTVLHGLDQPKLVSNCRDDDTYEQYVLQEFQLYRIYRLLTPASHAVRLLRMTYADSGSNKMLATRYAFIEEEPAELAGRLQARQSKLKGAGPDDLEPFQSALIGVFEYMIGNTDWGIGGLHNVELYQMPNGDNWPVVYDFDFSGAVNARYATVDPKLSVRRVRDRLYRGYCVPKEYYPRVFDVFNAKKDSIYALYKDSLGKLLKKDIADETLQYFDDFYKTINNPRSVKQEIMDACLGRK